MCGIAGRVNFMTGRPVQEDLVRGMCELLAHRGPDGEGVHVDGAVGLGHRRLAVIDLTPSAAQPMSTANGRLWITYNGEIYNFMELRARLERRGHRFRTRSDTEVILKAYEEFGTECVSHLRGMFAFAIWDAHERVLFAARDRLGKKPFVYLQDEDGLAFASEPKAFLADPGYRPEPDPEAISLYLSFQYIPAPLSGFRGVRKLPPAHSLLVRNGQVSIHRYWRLRYQPKRRIGETEALEELRSRLEEAVRLRLVSDVPLGAFLSGGLDSSLVVALMSRAGGRTVKTFSIGFDEKDYDELPFARTVAERYGTEHQELIVRPDAVEILPRLVWHYNEPYADSSAIPTFYLSEFTRRHVTVALNGDAGDENFAGYDRYLANVLASRSEWLPAPLARGLARLAQSLPAGRSRSLRSRARRFLESLAEPVPQRYLRWLVHFHPSDKPWLCTPEFLTAAGSDRTQALVEEAFAVSDGPDLVDATLDVDVRTYLPDDLLVKVDIATMAHGLEGRSPFLDHELMEFAASLPSHLKLQGTRKKHLLKQLAGPLVPADVIRRPKMGFGVPLEHWFRDQLRDVAHDVLLGSALRNRGYFDMTAVARLLDEHQRGVRLWHYQLWNLMFLELWHQTFIDRRPAGSRTRSLPGLMPAGAS